MAKHNTAEGSVLEHTYQSEPIKMTVCDNPIFIIGSPRSGTTILAWSLAQHSQLWTSEESEFLFGLFGDGQAEKALQKTLQRPLPSWLQVQGVDRPSVLKALGVGLNALYTSKSGGRRWIEHTPQYGLIATTLADMFPGALFLHVLRDGRSVVHSMIHVANKYTARDNIELRKKTGHLPPWLADFRSACSAWKYSVEACMAFQAMNPSRCLNVVNEELVANPSGGFARIFEFLGVPYEQPVVDYLQSNRINSSFPDRFRRDQTPTTRSKPWDSWSSKQRSVFVDEAGETMLKYGLAAADELWLTEKAVCLAQVARIREVVEDRATSEGECAIMLNGVLADIVNDPPTFFRDAEDKPVAWSIGVDVVAYLSECVNENSVTLETGAGVSTVAFALLGARHTSVVPSEEVVDRIRRYCTRRGVSLERTRFVIDRSENFLPRGSLQELDVVLIDGCHGFPAPFIDWYYSSLALRVGGVLLIDDTQIWTGKILVDFLGLEADWKFIRRLGKTAVFRKLKHVDCVKEWGSQPFVVSSSGPSSNLPAVSQSEYGEQIRRIRIALQKILPSGARTLVASKGDPELLNLGSSAAGHFPQDDRGEYAGWYPQSGAAALAHLADLQRAGWQYLLFPRTAFWWLDHYVELGPYLEEQCGGKRYQDDDCVVYSLMLSRFPATSHHISPLQPPCK